MSEPIPERRRGERLAVAPPLPARVAGHPVVLYEISLNGGRVEHDAPLAAAEPTRLTLQWDGDEFGIDCSVAHSERVGGNGADRFSSGLRFHVEDATVLRRLVAGIAAADEIDRLRKIVEASKLINSSIDADALFDSILGVARDELEVERGTLYFVDEATGEIWSKIAEGLGGGTREIRLPIGKGIAGSVAATGEPVLLFDAYSDPRFDRSLDLASGYRTRSMLCVPIRNRIGRTVGVLQLLNKKHGSFGGRDLDFLAAISEHMAIAMENATLHLSLLEKNRMERELQLGREIQSRLLPKPPCDVHETDLAALSLPCFEVGGDYYDFIEFGDGDLGIAIGDVSGKGVAAALIMSSIQSALRMAAPLESDLTALMARLNGLLFRMAGGRKYVTFFFGRYSPRTGELRYVSAGHNPVFVIDGESLTELASTGRPIGILPGATYEEATVVLPPHSTLFLYTDGLNEAADPAEEEFGMDRLRETVLATSGADATTVARRVLDSVATFEQGTHATDDKTVVVLRRGVNRGC